MTQPTRAAVEAATKVLAKAALLDPRISAGDEGTILAWAEILAPVSWHIGDLMAAVATHYATSVERILPADVLRLARAANRDRLDRTALNGPERRELEARSDAKAGDTDATQTAHQLPPATAKARAAALAAAAAKIGNTHDVDTPTTFPHAPKPARTDSPATIAAKVARARAAAPPVWQGRNALAGPDALGADA